MLGTENGRAHEVKGRYSLVPRQLDAADAAGAAADSPRSAIALARVNQPALTTWLQEAINLVLAGHALRHPHPAGSLIERGSFEPEGEWVWARDWYGRGKRVAVVHCGGSTVARDLAGRLNRLLDETAA